MDLRQLTAIVAVVDHGGFTRAAEALHIAQPSISQTVKSLERELGVSLFDRSAPPRSGPRLTAAGAALLAPARQALRDLDTARAAVAGVVELRSGHVDLVCLPTLAADPVAAIIGRFRTAHPGITVRLAEPDHADSLMRMVMTGESEIGFTELSAIGRAAPEALSTVELETQDYVAVVPRTMFDEQDRDRGRVELHELARHPLITTPLGTSTRRLIDEAFAGVEAEPQIAVETEHREAITALVRSGAGYSLLPRPVAEHIARRDARTIEISTPIRRRIGMVSRRGTLSPAAAALVEMVARGSRQSL